MPRIEIVYYREDDGSIPLVDWLERLEELGHDLRRPEADYLGNDLFERLASLEEERLNAAIARQIYDLRTQAGLTQRQLAHKVGTTASVICKLEDADYEGHSLSMLHRIAASLAHRVEIRFVPRAGKAPARRRRKRKVA